MIQPIGFIKLHRELASKPIWLKSTVEQKVILVTLLMMANFKSNEWEWKGEKFEVKPGQFITSLDSIVKECGKGVSIQNVRTALARFEKLDFLTDKPTKEGRLITIANWDLYQVDNKQPNKPNNKDLTKGSQTPNKDLTPKEEGKKEKKEKKVFIPPTLQNVIDYCNERENGVDAKRFYDSYSVSNWVDSKGNNVHNWKQKLIQVWEKNNDNIKSKQRDNLQSKYTGFNDYYESED